MLKYLPIRKGLKEGSFGLSFLFFRFREGILLRFCTSESYPCKAVSKVGPYAIPRAGGIARAGELFITFG